jgi:cytochrome P450
MEQKGSVPIEKGMPLLGIALELQKDPLGTIQGLWKKNGDVFRFRLGPQTMYFVNRPEYVMHVLLRNQKNYDKRNLMYSEMQTLFGNATSVVDGERWKKGHSLIQPSFSFAQVEKMSTVISQSIQDILATWVPKSESGECIDMGEDIHRMTLEVIVRTMFGASIHGQEEKVTALFRTLLDVIVARITSPVKLPTWIPTPLNRRYRSARKDLDEIIVKIVQSKIQNLENGGQEVSSDGYQDMLSQWIEAEREKNGGKLDIEFLRDEVIGIFVAGHGSTAVFMSWTFYHLATHPEIQEKVYREVKEVFGNDTPAYAKLADLRYTRQVIEESMRITPPGWIISRSTIQEDQMGELKIPPRSMIWISPYLIHHHPEFWPDPERFDPERFAPQNAEQIKKASKDGYYIPFSAGPRVCTGKNMAMIECLLIVAMTLQKFEVRLKKDHVVTPVGGFTLGLGGGLLVHLKKR